MTGKEIYPLRYRINKKMVDRAEAYRSIAPNIWNPRPPIPKEDDDRFKNIDPKYWPF